MCVDFCAKNKYKAYKNKSQGKYNEKNNLFFGTFAINCMGR
jgi:hypothetical protein